MKVQFKIYDTCISDDFMCPMIGVRRAGLDGMGRLVLMGVSLLFHDQIT